MTIDRTEVARALAKAIAFKQCGNDQEANEWAAHLIALLGCAGILSGTGYENIEADAENFQ